LRKTVLRRKIAVALMVMQKVKSTVEEAVTVERENDPWEPPVREAVRSAREQGRIAVIVVHGWDFSRSLEPAGFEEALVRSEKSVNSAEAQGAANAPTAARAAR
jgi:hypothetical protein